MVSHFTKSFSTAGPHKCGALYSPKGMGKMAKKKGKAQPKKKGRPALYDKKVRPHLKKIEDLALNASEQQIAKILGVAYSTFRNYKNTYKELEDALGRGRAELVCDLKSTLIKKAKGFTYEEKKIIKNKKGEVMREEIYVKQALPDTASANLLLKNYDPENWANDPQALALQKELIELKKKQAEDNDW